MPAGHVWYPEDNPLQGDPNAADVLAVLASLHTAEDKPWADRYLTADDVKALRKDGV